jgi:hypothetical protein
MAETGLDNTWFRACCRIFALLGKTSADRTGIQNHLLLLRLRDPKWMRFGVENIVVETDNVRFAEDEEKVFQRFRHPETL